MTNLIGQSLGRYHILEQLGEGGMATVYKAYDTRLENEVAVKVIRTENLAPSILERSLKRFEREAKSLAKLTHANIVNILDYGDYEGKPYLVMPYLPGGTLKQKLQGKPMQYQEAARHLIPIAKALAYAHQQGMVHRDVKPANILITHSGDPMLTDFGIAKIIDEETTLDLTGTSAAVGTPEYMAPEQTTSKTTDHRVDIYALGIVYYEMVAGRKPFQADTPLAVLFKQASEPLPRPNQFVTGIPDQVEKVLVKALAKKPDDRYQTMGEFAKALESLITVSFPAPKPVRPIKEPISRSTQIPATTQATSSIPKRTIPFWLGIPVIGILVAAVLFGWLAKGGMAEIFPTSTPSFTPTPLATATLEFGIGSTMIGQDGATLVYVPAGEFTMGSNGGDGNERPVHTVNLDAFWIDQTEVTNAAYSKCVDAGKCKPPGSVDHYNDPGYTNHPVVYVSWGQASAYCSWVERRLPTEAEWEKAARGTDARTYPWGNYAPNESLLNWNLKVGDTSPVGNYDSGKSPYGAYDMAGNVWEWVSDWYGQTYYQTSSSKNPKGPSSGDYRVLRGGSWNYNDYNVRSASRMRNTPTVTLINGGVRCARGTSP